MRIFVTGPIFGEDAWLFSASPELPSTLEVVFTVPIRIRKVRVSGRMVAIDDRDADVVEMAERLGVDVLVGTSMRYFVRERVDVGGEVKIWFSKTADAGVTARFRWSEIAG